MKCICTAALAALVSVCGAARGDLGDTMSQAEARYGAAQGTKKEQTSGAITKFYFHGAYGIAVKFIDSKSQSETFIKGKRAAFSDAEIVELLKANAMGSEWRSVYKTAGSQRWELKSREATAVYSVGDRALVFTTKDYIRSQTKLKLVDPGD